MWYKKIEDIKQESTLNIETKIKMDRFKPRSYQLNLIKAVESGKRRCMAIWPRRSGKDLCGFNILVKEAFRRVGTYFYIFPTFNSGRRILWDAIDNDGRRILDYFAPKEIIESRNEQQMRIRFINGSQIQILGSDNFDNSIIGTNSKGMIFSEYALQSDLPYKFARPILSASDGFAIILSTPRGKNHLFEMYEIARHSPDWFCELLTIENTNHIPLSEIEKERQLGELSDDMIMQEYHCSFQFGVEGSYYSKYIDKMNLNNQIGVVPWEPGFKVHVAMDIGVRDSTSLIFFQTIGQTVRIIDCYENSKVGLEHYVSVIRSKENEIGYVYGRFIVPHDMKVMEWGSGVTRIEKAKQLGLNCTVAPDIGLMDGIECVRTTLGKVWIDNKKCIKLIRALENYRQEYDAKKKVYNTHPLHDQHSHFCFTGDTPILTRNGIRQLMLIEENDEILTLYGWAKCTKANRTLRDANLVAVKFTDGTIVKCTPDHLFLTVDGWKSAESLQKGTRIQSFLMESFNTLMALYTEFGRMKDTFQKEDPPCTAMCGVVLLELFRIIATFTTKIQMHPTMHYGILNACQKKSTSSCLDQIIKDLEIRQENRLPNGMLQMLEDCGIRDMLLDLLRGLNGSVNREHAIIAIKYSIALLEKMAMNKNFAIQTVKNLFIESVNCLDEKQDVYDITVPLDHDRVPYDKFQRHGIFGQFSLSNGAIVHNSDAMRYLCISLPKTRDGLSAEDLDKRYNQARGGDTLPSFFRDQI